VIGMVMDVRGSDEEETVGLDLALHNERGYNL
jgi:Amt family ammonium transporter